MRVSREVMVTGVLLWCEVGGVDLIACSMGWEGLGGVACEGGGTSAKAGCRMD